MFDRGHARHGRDLVLPGLVHRPGDHAYRAEDLLDAHAGRPQSLGDVVDRAAGSRT
ncbi:hypothetical protein HC028_25060 [Planosporangium flavigriseum]|uniref:hypothetical protein n=1 Tax=Planosporangium flavigriseum TaxID=373681 RepID=UPI001438F1DE|nr:hypothetical protein [Planosporangium flavigriseum]NJC67751.1 hypothetical protein [Planosporangium flavigriseum]